MNMTVLMIIEVLSFVSIILMLGYSFKVMFHMYRNSELFGTRKYLWILLNFCLTPVTPIVYAHHFAPELLEKTKLMTKILGIFILLQVGVMILQTIGKFESMNMVIVTLSGTALFIFLGLIPIITVYHALIHVKDNQKMLLWIFSHCFFFFLTSFAYAFVATQDSKLRKIMKYVLISFPIVLCIFAFSILKVNKEQTQKRLLQHKQQEEQRILQEKIKAKKEQANKDKHAEQDIPLATQAIPTKALQVSPTVNPLAEAEHSTQTHTFIGSVSVVDLSLQDFLSAPNYLGTEQQSTPVEVAIPDLPPLPNKMSDPLASFELSPILELEQVSNQNQKSVADIGLPTMPPLVEFTQADRYPSLEAPTPSKPHTQPLTKSIAQPRVQNEPFFLVEYLKSNQVLLTINRSERHVKSISCQTPEGLFISLINQGHASILNKSLHFIQTPDRFPADIIWQVQLKGSRSPLTKHTQHRPLSLSKELSLKQ